MRSRTTPSSGTSWQGSEPPGQRAATQVRANNPPAFTRMMPDDHVAGTMLRPPRARHHRDEQYERQQRQERDAKQRPRHL